MMRIGLISPGYKLFGLLHDSLHSFFLENRFEVGNVVGLFDDKAFLKRVSVQVWVASLCKIFLASWSPRKTMFLTNTGGIFCKKNVLMVIAHPDDESMFFTPTINYLTSSGHSVHILCMSTGNADGIGNIRKEELYQASAILKVPLQQVKILDHQNFQDGFGMTLIYLLRLLDRKLMLMQLMLRLLRDALHRDIEAWELVSVNIWRKYSGPIDVWFSFLHARRFSDGLQCLLNGEPCKSYAAMAQHMSQWVWFRKLFVSFSSYTFVNTLKKIDK